MYKYLFSKLLKHLLQKVWNGSSSYQHKLLDANVFLH